MTGRRDWLTGRRDWLGMAMGLAGAVAAPRAAAQAFPGESFQHPGADPGYRMTFPRDFGAHAGFRTEWWYVTGWLGGDRGFQVTFFRVRTSHPAANPSRFAPTQLLFAQAALMLPRNRHPLHGQRAARIGSPGAAFSEEDANLAIGDWTLARGSDDRYRAVIRDSGFSLDLVLAPPGTPGQPINRPWLQGGQGFSRKGPEADQASHYYSRPQLQVSGSVDGKPAAGIAWFDHEWSTSYLAPSAAGWDWTGLNHDDGSALMAFRIRRRLGDRSDPNVAPNVAPNTRDRGTDPRADEPEPLWHYCARRHPDGRTEQFESVVFQVLRRWQSPRTLTTYPVAMRLVLPDRVLRLEPLFDDQEIDGRQSTGTIYWEGAVRVIEEAGAARESRLGLEPDGSRRDNAGGYHGGNSANDRRVGVGYLELTGYNTPLKF
jgi:predicted secreted hydrolase